MVEKLLLQLCYTVIQLPFKGFQNLFGGGGFPPPPPPCSSSILQSVHQVLSRCENKEEIAIW